MRAPGLLQGFQPASPETAEAAALPVVVRIHRRDDGHCSIHDAYMGVAGRNL